MNSIPLPLLAAIAAAPFAHALDTSPWKFTQTVETAPGALSALDLPDATLDAARADLADIRIVDANGVEVPYVLDRLGFIRSVEYAGMRSAKNFVTTLEGNATRITLETDTTGPVDGIDLFTPGVSFLKPVRVEGSSDGVNWTTLAEGLPIFRQKNGAENLRVNFPAGVHKHLRLTVDDSREDPVPFTGARLHGVIKTSSSDPRRKVPVSIVSREERPGGTWLTLDLGAANLPLSGLTLDTPEPLFTRRVSLAAETPGEEGRFTAAQGSIWNISGLGGEPSSQKRLSVEAQIRTRRITLVIHNGDSPPLAIAGVSADRRPRRLLFVAPQGPVTLRSGHPAVAAPRYDLDLLAAKIKTAATAPATVGPLTPNPGYKPFVPPTPSVLAGAAIDTTPWKASKKVRLSAPGAQRLELDLETLCHARPDLGDLRLVSDGIQTPYLIEHSGERRRHPVESTELPPNTEGTTSRYRLALPPGAPPVIAVDWQGGPPGGFVRKVRLLREEKTPRDGVRVLELAAGTWNGMTSRDAPDNTTVLNLPAPLAPSHDADGGPSLIVEIINGSDAPIRPLDFRIHTPVTKLLFVAPTSGNLALHFANPGATAPNYGDIRIAATRLNAAPSSAPTLGPIEGDLSPSATRRHAGPILWISLAAVVAGLLFAVTRMLPKDSSK